MTPTPLLQFTSVRTSVVGGKTLIGLKHTAKTSAGLPLSTTWIDMHPEDVELLIKTLHDTLAELGRK